MRYIAFLRGINVSGKNLIKMEALKQYFDLPGFKNIVTYIQSGNVLFDAPKADEQKLRNKIEQQLTGKLGYEVPVIVRSLDALRTTLSQNPFPGIAASDPRKLYFIFLSEAPPVAVHDALDAYKNKLEELKIIGRELYILTDGIGNSKLTLALIEKKLGVTATMRNLATVQKVLEL